MLSTDENDRVTKVGPGSPCGELFRRYWWPVAFADDIHGPRPKPVRLLGENFVLFRDGQGRLGMIEALCAHRRTTLANGRAEAAGIRCCYHGWLFDCEGRCLEQPCEDPENTFKDRVRMRAAKTQELAGLVWAYIGVEAAPLLPKWDILVRPDGDQYPWGFTEHCNWLQSVENACDMTHLGWLHAGSYPDYAYKRPNILWERFEYGLRYTITQDNLRGDNVGQLLLPLTTRFASARVDQGPRHNLVFRVPTDDVTTTHFLVLFCPKGQPTGMLPTRWTDTKRNVYERVDDDWWAVASFDQDRMAVEGQGLIADRSTEHLAASDRGVTIYRQWLREELDRVAKGQDPINIFREAPSQRMVEFDTHMYEFTPPLRLLNPAAV